MIVGAFLLPMQVAFRAGVGVMGLYLLFTALAGTCLGYRLMGRSTCRLEQR